MCCSMRAIGSPSLSERIRIQRRIATGEWCGYCLWMFSIRVPVLLRRSKLFQAGFVAALLHLALPREDISVLQEFLFPMTLCAGKTVVFSAFFLHRNTPLGPCTSRFVPSRCVCYGAMDCAGEAPFLAAPPHLQLLLLSCTCCCVENNVALVVYDQSPLCTVCLCFAESCAVHGPYLRPTSSIYLRAVAQLADAEAARSKWLRHSNEGASRNDAVLGFFEDA